MNPLSSLIGAAKSAWGAISGAASAGAGALSSMWSYVTSVHDMVSWLMSNPLLELAKNTLEALNVFHVDQLAARDALSRVARWIYATWIAPTAARLQRHINSLEAWTRQQVGRLGALIALRYRQAIAYAAKLTAAERSARVKGDQTERKVMLASVAAALATVQKQAASGYNTGTKGRLEVVQSLLTKIGDDNPAVKGLVSKLVSGVVDLAEVDDPLIALALSKTLTEVIDKAGVDSVTSGLITDLFGAAAAQPKATGLYSTEKDVAGRLNVLEAQWAQFMNNGGQDVEDAGEQWAALTELAFLGSAMAFFELARGDPAAWATGVQDTVGLVVEGYVGVILDIIHHT